MLGGHGFISEWGLEQEFRDTRITAIYEGTNTIQGLDLLGRKILASGGKVAESFMAQVKAFCEQDHAGDVAPLAASLMESLQLWQSLTEEVGKRAMDGEADAVGSAAYDYLMVAGFTTLAYFLAKGASVAAAALAAGTSEEDYYKAKIANARFYFERLLPRTQAYAATIRSSSSNLMDYTEAQFGL